MRNLGDCRELYLDLSLPTRPIADTSKPFRVIFSHFPLVFELVASALRLASAVGDSSPICCVVAVARLTPFVAIIWLFCIDKTLFGSKWQFENAKQVVICMHDTQLI